MCAASQLGCDGGGVAGAVPDEPQGNDGAGGLPRRGLYGEGRDRHCVPQCMCLGAGRFGQWMLIDIAIGLQLCGPTAVIIMPQNKQLSYYSGGFAHFRDTVGMPQSPPASPSMRRSMSMATQALLPVILVYPSVASSLCGSTESRTRAMPIWYTFLETLSEGSLTPAIPALHSREPGRARGHPSAPRPGQGPAPGIHLPQPRCPRWVCRHALMHEAQPHAML